MHCRRRGVDVRLLVPAIPDKKYAYMVAETYWGELLSHGVKIYKYTPGFLHAKSVLVDRRMPWWAAPTWITARSSSTTSVVF